MEPVIKTGDPRQDNAIQKAIEAMVRRINGYQCAEMVGVCALKLLPGAHINSYRTLASTLNGMGDKHRKLDTMLSFMVGDALSQGEMIYGEEYACVVGVELNRWRLTSLRQMQSVAERVPPENRKLNLSFHMHKDLAYLPPGDQAYYLGLAEELYLRREPDFRTKVLTQMYDEKGRVIISRLPEDEQQEWLDLIRRHKINPRRLEGMIEGRIPIPREKSDAEAFFRRLLAHCDEEIGGRKEVARQHVMDMLADAIWKTLTACREKEVKFGSPDKLWAKPIPKEFK